MDFKLTPSLIARFWAKVDCSGEHWLWTGATSPNGYGSIGAGGKGGKTLYAHHVAFAIQNGELPEGQRVVRHKCDIKLCMRGKCLIPGTQQDNNRDRDERGRTRKGEAHPLAKFSEVDVRQMRLLLSKPGSSKREVMERYKISRGALIAIIQRRTWKHVE